MNRPPLYLRARTCGRITGRVLHLPVWAPDPPGTVLFAGTGRYVPACGRQGAAGLWDRTGPEHPGWARHAHWAPCTRCVTMLAHLLAVALTQDSRHKLATPPDREDHQP